MSPSVNLRDGLYLLTRPLEFKLGHRKTSAGTCLCTFGI